jgi:hypothetical protein
LLLAALSAWIIWDLNAAGTAVTSFAVLFAASLLLLQATVFVIALTSRCAAAMPWRWLAAVYVGGLLTAGVFALMGGNLRSLLLQPGAKLPPNEIFGSQWPLFLAVASFQLAQLLSLAPLSVITLAIAIDRRRLRRPAASTEVESHPL